jgi:hypothetical protein
VGVSKQLGHLILGFIIRFNRPILSIESSRLLERKQPDYLVLLDPTITVILNSMNCLFL